MEEKENMKKMLEKKQALLHQAVTYFEDAPCYTKKDLLCLHEKYSEFAHEKNMDKLQEMTEAFEEMLLQIKPTHNAPKKIMLWTEGNMPTLGHYTENPNYQYNHDPDFKPYMYPMLISENLKPRGAVIVCAGGDHGECTLHEGYQTCLDLNKLGYQCFLLLNRTNHCPYDAKEAGADAARAIQIVRRDAKAYGIDANHVVFAGFSNGGLTAEACIQYFSGTQKIKNHFKNYIPEALDDYYSAPDAVLCIYGPRFKDSSFDYTNVVYPPTFFAVGREDSAMENLNATWADLIAHGVEVEVHTFSGVPHGQSGVSFYGNYSYPHFQLWLPLADTFMQNVFSKNVIKRTPDVLEDANYRYDAFENGIPLLGKKKKHLPAMGWNSWNAFGSGNTEALTKAMADAMVELELDELGYQYVVLDDGCYKPKRVEGKLANEAVKFPSGFKALADYIHDKGLKFGMYNDIGTNLCAGAAVGTCGHEAIDAKSYIDWGVDFLKVDNCYYLWDNATFSNRANAKYVFAPNIKGIKVIGQDDEMSYEAVKDGILLGEGAEKKEEYITHIGTFDGTGPDIAPVGARSGEVAFKVEAPADGEYELVINYATGQEEGVGSWLQVAVGEKEETHIFYDDFVAATENTETFRESESIKITLKKGENLIRLMNHRRQENTLSSYAALLEGLNVANPEHDVIFSICEWGKTQPQNWGYKVGDSWRILNDITFQVGSDGDPGKGNWIADYTTSVTAQYNKAVIMDEFSGLDKGWNDPDMLMIGMNGLDETMCKTHMTMWCMMNSPLMLGLDLRRVQKEDNVWKIIANKGLIALNQDALGIQAKRIWSSYKTQSPDTEYIRDNNRVDILAKPLSDGSVALSFINVSIEKKQAKYSVSVFDIIEKIGHKMKEKEKFQKAEIYEVINLWNGEKVENRAKEFVVNELQPCDNVTIKVVPMDK